MYQYILFIALQVSLICCVRPSVSAHPVTFEGGVAISIMSQPGVNLWHANYSLSSKLALGVDYMRVGEAGSSKLGLARLNTLVKRWMGRGSQGNLYLMTGIGVADWGHQSVDGSNDQFREAWMIGVQTDYETQRFYTALIGRVLGDRDLTVKDVTVHALYRFGVAPYIARSNELQSWLVGQLTYHSEMSGPPSLTMLMRVFHRSALWELGADTEGRPWLQLMAHY